MESEGTTASVDDLSQEILKKDDLRAQTQCDRIHRHTNDQLSNSTKIFVGGLPADLTVDEFRDYFQKFGSMEDVVVMCDKETSRPRGFGFVTFESPETAEKVLKNRFYELKNKRVEVKKAVSKERMSRNFGNYYDTYNAVYNGTTFPFTASSSYDTYSYQSPYYYGNTPYSSKRTHKYRNRTPNVLKDGDDDSNIVIKNAANLVQKLEDLHLGSDGQANGDGDGDGDHTEISEEGLSLDCNGCGDGGGCAVVIDQDLSL
ncbi:hypothetical protein Ccrd_018978 [Cynara cardunculus var. scolymus]|uniref:RRM domain-containing protein n=1 Tax=Cynara cardunculus var. scolymus TaxID=59895 RepID=A0A118K1F7_CYNCS|nr:hypothetical protein Ccrd_018978 [Cynara cardunculus var. scolymus]